MTNFAALLSDLLRDTEAYRAAETKSWMERNKATTQLKITTELCRKALQEHEKDTDTED